MSALPGEILHADWSVSPVKRQVARAVLSSGRYVLGLPQQAVEADDLLGCFGLSAVAPTSDVARLIGVDFPLGLPSAYARLAGVIDFPSFVSEFAAGGLPRLGAVATRPEEIAVDRPFYPARPGGALRRHLTEGLGLDAGELRRRCEGKDAEVVFWTLGAKQVGKGALLGWRLLGRSLAKPDAAVFLWPFAGRLADLFSRDACRRGAVVVAESYPAESARHLAAAAARASMEVPRRLVKRDPTSRALWAPSRLRTSLRDSPARGRARTPSTPSSACSDWSK